GGVVGGGGGWWGWWGMGRYLCARGWAAMTICLSESRPSLYVVCMWRSPRMSSRSTSRGTRRVAAASSASTACRSCGGTYARPACVYTSVSDVLSRTPRLFWTSATCAGGPVVAKSAVPCSSGVAMRTSTSCPWKRSTTRRVARNTTSVTMGSAAIVSTAGEGREARPTTDRAVTVGSARRTPPVGSSACTSGQAAAIAAIRGSRISQARPSVTARCSSASSGAAFRSAGVEAHGRASAIASSRSGSMTMPSRTSACSCAASTRRSSARRRTREGLGAVALSVFVEVYRNRGGRSAFDRRHDLALGELRILEDDFTHAEPDGDVRQRRLAGGLAVDEHLGPGRRVDGRPAARIERHVSRVARLDVDALRRRVLEIPVLQAQHVMAGTENDLADARAERLAVLGDLDDERRRELDETGVHGGVDRERLPGFHADRPLERSARPLQREHV